MNQTIYIDGKARRCTPLYAHYTVCTFFVDSEEMPHTRCAQHTLSGVSVSHLQAGGGVHTGGHHYSLSPPMFMKPPVVKNRPTTLRRHLELWGVTYAALFFWLLAVLAMWLFGHPK